MRKADFPLAPHSDYFRKYPFCKVGLPRIAQSHDAGSHYSFAKKPQIILDKICLHTYIGQIEL